MKNAFRLSLMLCSLLVISSCKNSDLEEGSREKFEFAFRIPAGENSWVSNSSEKGVIQKEGIKGWDNSELVLNSYIRVNAPGQLALGLQAASPSGPARIQVSLGGETREVEVGNKELQQINIGNFQIDEPGYQLIEIRGLERSGEFFPEITEILAGGEATEKGVNFVEENFHFGRRGPSVHLRYELPEEKDLLWFYNEIEVPEGEDVIGSYFMANGFSHGYFGIQVNSETERRVLFSVWSPYETQDPAEIPEEYRIQMLQKGTDVHTGEFGNEGSGGQSYRKFPWKAGTTYKFLLKGEPNGDNSTDFTAWFYAPEVGESELIASFRRPFTNTYLKDLYSFLENFVPATGDTARKGYYTNQWGYSTDGQWTEMTRAEFTADATAKAGHRLDYAGGADENGFFLKDCGFFNQTTPMNSFFSRPATGFTPEVDLARLERIMGE